MNDPVEKSTPFQRVQQERAQLDERLAKLGEFIVSNPFFKKLPAAERRRQRKQAKIMNAYLVILDERMANWNVQ